MKRFVIPVPRTNTVVGLLRQTAAVSLLLIGTSMAWGTATASANQAEPEAEGEADKVVEYTPAPKKIAIGENRKWTYWNALMPGQQVTIQFKEPAAVTLSARKMLYPQDSGKDQPVAIHLQEGGKTREIRLKAEETSAVVNKSDAKPGPVEVSTHQVAAGTRWTLTGPAGRAPAAYLVETSPVAALKAPPAFVATGAETGGEEESREEEIKRWFIGPSIGYLYGIGDVSSLHAELDAGYRLPWLDNALAVKLSGGWYASSKIEQESDPLIGDFENEWHLRAIPISLNIEYWIPIKRFTAFGGLGFEYTLANFRFESRNALGIISPEDVTDGSAMGTRFYGGARFTAGPGDIVGALQFSSSNINNDFSEYTGDLGGLSILVGYQFTF